MRGSRQSALSPAQANRDLRNASSRAARLASHRTSTAASLDSTAPAIAFNSTDIHLPSHSQRRQLHPCCPMGFRRPSCSFHHACDPPLQCSASFHSAFWRLLTLARAPRDQQPKQHVDKARFGVSSIRFCPSLTRSRLGKEKREGLFLV
jgi:hypothetical protein